MDGVGGKNSLHPTSFCASLDVFLNGHPAPAHCLMVQCLVFMFSGRLVSDSVTSCLEQEKLHGEVGILSGHQETYNEAKNTRMLELIFRGRLFT